MIYCLLCGSDRAYIFPSWLIFTDGMSVTFYPENVCPDFTNQNHFSLNIQHLEYLHQQCPPPHWGGCHERHSLELTAGLLSWSWPAEMKVAQSLSLPMTGLSLVRWPETGQSEARPGGVWSNTDTAIFTVSLITSCERKLLLFQIMAVNTDSLARHTGRGFKLSGL